MSDDAPPEKEGLERLVGEGGIDPKTVEELSDFLAQRKVDARQRWIRGDAVQTLQGARVAFHDASTFKVGDVIRWKDRLKNKTIPPYGVPVVVVEVLPEPVLNSESSSGSKYFREPLDLVVALFMENDSGGEDTIEMFHFDSRRFEHHPDFTKSDDKK
jgi:hypothetical protein